MNTASNHQSSAPLIFQRYPKNWPIVRVPRLQTRDGSPLIAKQGKNFDRYLNLTGMINLQFANETNLQFYQSTAPDNARLEFLRLPLPTYFPQLWLYEHTQLRDIWGAVDLGTYDTAIPLDFSRAYANLNGGEWPRGVWLYEGEYKHFGAFYSLQCALSDLRSAIVRGAVASFGLPIDGSSNSQNSPAPALINEGGKE